jgi:heme/copper-type cytochrome/quinol oxidase subunit 3
LQHCEYVESTFTIYDGVYGSTFFMATGFHGFHVIIGTIFIFVSLARFYNLQFSRTHNIGFEASAWYWHFVDVVWLFLFISIYWWGNYKGEEGFLYLTFVNHYNCL